MEVPQGTFTLKRLPNKHDPSLRAWDAADVYALEHLHQEWSQASHSDRPGMIVVVNDSFGALAVALADLGPQAISDSIISQQATIENLKANRGAADGVQFFGPLDRLGHNLGTVIIKVPKSLALLEFQLAQLAPSLTPATVVVGAGMAKHIHKSTLEAFERFVGPTTTSLAKKKARLIFARPSQDVLNQPDLHREATSPTDFQLGDGTPIVSYPGVFSQRRLDQATALLLGHIPGGVLGHIVDLGCGSGALGVVAGKQNSDATVHFVDASHLAVASAKQSWERSYGSDRQASFVTAADLGFFEDASVELVLNNPPFHADRAMGDATAWHMFSESRRVLEPGGHLFVVGNRHLGYQPKLKRLFGNCDMVASDPKFIVLRSRR